jgi:hypothetical protein
LDISDSAITNVSGLSGLTLATNLHLYGNPNLNDLSGLSKLDLTGILMLDERDYSTKIPSSSPICLNDTVATTSDGVTILLKTNYCEE